MLTLSQRKVYEFIQQFIQDHDYSPTMAEIAKGIGIQSRGVVHRYVAALVTEGLINITPGKRRNIHLINSESVLRLEGKIAAGSPIEAIPENETLDIVNIFLGANRYALKVKGDSMIEEGIFDGDVVVCEYCNAPADGKIVVALIDQLEATLKRIKYDSDDTITLIPANSNLLPITYSRDRVTIQGIYIGLLRFEGNF
ncbi:MAG: repressor LexA [Gammaproteobacteria bacterium]|nr:repressor LexA [Gammaproteobacteria bacterium]